MTSKTAWPIITDEHRYHMSTAIESGNLVKGQYTNELESKWSEYIGIEHTFAVNTGTAGLHMALKALKLGPGDEVITTSYSWYSTALAISYTGATPVFIDIGDDYNIDVSKIKAAINERTAAILVVHIHGHPAEMIEINLLAQEFGLWVVEDACQAHGAKYHDQYAGTLADISVFSLQQSKVVFGGEGGLICTNNRDLAEWMYTKREMGRGVTETAWNYRITEVSAALAVVGIDLLYSYNEMATNNVEIIKKHLEDYPFMKFVEVPSWIEPTWHKVRLECPEDIRVAIELDDFVDCHIWPSPNPYPFPMLPAFRQYRGFTYDNALKKLENSICLFNQRAPVWCQYEDVGYEYGERLQAIAKQIKL